MGVSNLRELSGLRSEDGRYIRKNVLFRSGHLAKLRTGSRKCRKQKLQFDEVIDLRSPSEIKEKPDRISEHVAYHHLPLLNDQENPSVNRENRLSILKERIAYPGGTRAFLRQQYASMIISENALEYFRKIITILRTEKDKRFIFHCTQGKDRTGVAVAVVLMTLGVPRSSIMRDYLKTNARCRIKNYLIFLGTAVATLSLQKPVQLHQLMTAKEEYMNAVFDVIDRLYGGTERFIHETLHIDDEMLRELRDDFLVSGYAE